MRELRKKTGLKQTQVASLIGVSISTYRDWELGLRTPNAKYILELCRVFGCTEAELLGTVVKDDRTPKSLSKIFFTYPSSPIYIYSKVNE